LDIATCQLISVPRELGIIQTLESLSISWFSEKDAESPGKMFLNLTEHEFYTIENLLPSLSEDSCERERFLDAVYPPIYLGFLCFLKQLKLSIRGDFIYLKKDEKWQCRPSCSSTFYDVEEEYSTIPGKLNVVCGENGIFFLFPYPFCQVISNQHSTLQKDDIVSFGYDNSIYWIKDRENTLWFSQVSFYFRSQLGFILPKDVLLPQISFVLDKRLEDYSDSWILDTDNNILRVRLSENNTIRKIPDNLPPLQFIKSGKNFILGIDLKGVLWEISVFSYTEQSAVNLSSKYNLPPVKYAIPVSFSLPDSFGYYAIDYDGNVWAKGFNEKGILGVNITDKSWISDFVKVPFDEPIIHIDTKESMILFASASGGIYVQSRVLFPKVPLHKLIGEISCTSIPIITDLHYRRKKYHKSARK